MKTTTFNALFYIKRTRLTKKGEAPILLRITVNGTRAVCAVPLKVKPEHWNSRDGRSTGRDRESKALNLHLETIRVRIMQIHIEMEVEGKGFEAQAIINKYQGKDAKPKIMLMNVFQEHIDQYRKLSEKGMIAPATVERYQITFKHIEGFIKFSRRKDDVPIEDVDHKFITDLEFHIKTERNCAHNTTMKYLKNLKKVINIALADEYITKDPFIKIRFSFTKVDREALSGSEIRCLMSKKFSIKRLSQVRDFFVFACFTGLAFSDLQGLKKEHIVKDENGRVWIKKKRQKTKTMCKIPLLEIPERVLEMYKKHPLCATTDRALPIGSNTKMNAYLKEVMDLCGIDKNVSTHIARHTFATYMLSKGVALSNLADMLGHTNTKITQLYAKVLDQSIMDDMLKVDEQIDFTW